MSEATSGWNQQISDLNIEANRLKTFDTWNVSFINKQTLALLGFYYNGPKDLVKCVFCGVKIGTWEEGDDVLADHIKWSPFCHFIRRNCTNNVPIDATLLNQTLPPKPTNDVCGTVLLTNTVSEGSIDSVRWNKMGGIEDFLRGGHHQDQSKQTITKAEFPEYAVEALRIKSYADWPQIRKQRPKQLSDAGFFYIGKGDRVICFCCGGGLKDWEINDDPWEEHAKWYGKCEFLKSMKSPDFISKMIELGKTKNAEYKFETDRVGSCSSQ